MVQDIFKKKDSIHRPLNTLYLYTFIPVLILIHSTVFLQAQSIKTNRQLLSEHYQLNKTSELKNTSINNTKPLVYKNNKVLVRYNPLGLSLKGAMYFYQKVVSPQLFRHCIYEISCSSYSKMLIQQYGIIKGILLTADRLTRCNSLVREETKASDFNKSGLIIDKQVIIHHHQ